MSADSNYALIGAPYDKSGVGGSYLYARAGFQWSQAYGSIIYGADGGSAVNNRGYSVALNSDATYLFVGAPCDSQSGTTKKGAAYVFTQSGNSVSPQTILTPSTGGTYTNYGASVATDASGLTLAMGGPGDLCSGGAGSFSSVAYFTRSGTTWTFQAAPASGTLAERCGAAVAMSSDGQYLVSGCPNPTGTGYIFVNPPQGTGSRWLLNSITISAPTSGSLYGAALALSSVGDLLVVGAPGAGSNQGAIYTYTRAGANTWTLASTVTGSGASDYFGSSLSYDSVTQILAVGAASVSSTGYVSMYHWNGGGWDFIQQLISSPGTGARQGFSVATAARYVLVGGPADASNVGAAWPWSSIAATSTPTNNPTTSPTTSRPSKNPSKNPTTSRPTISPTFLGTYIPAGWGSYWSARLANSSTTLARIAVVGDSISEGYSASDWLFKSYVGITRSTFQSTNGIGGTGFRSVKSAAPLVGFTVTQSYAETVGTWGVSDQSGGPGAIIMTTDVNGRQIKFYNMVGTTVEVYYTRATVSGSFTVQINAGTAVTVNANAGSTVMGIYTVTGVAAGNNTVTITCQSNPNYTPIFGARSYNAKGVVVDNYSAAGQTSGRFLSNTDTYQVGSASYWSGGTGIPCDLLIYALGVNDANGQTGFATTVDAYAANVVTSFTAARLNRGTDVDLVVFLPHIGNWQGSGPDYQAMTAKMLAIADQYRAAVIAMGPRYSNSYSVAQTAGIWGPNPDGPSGASGTNPIHPSNIGHAAYANALLSVIWAPYRATAGPTPAVG